MTGKAKSFRISHIFFWSVISAAFIGPGTITTALKAGSNYQLDLLWAIFFSIAACMVLQEAASRITIASGLTLGEVIQQKYGRRRILNINQLLTVSIIFGCIAYQAGNMTGAIKGIQLILELPKQAILLIIFLLAAILMWKGKIRLITNILGFLVALMALLFIIMAFQSNLSIYEILKSTFQPGMPKGSSLLVIGLIGTTIVPYNLFLGSGLSRNKDLKSTRFGLISAILLGGLITIFILITGTLIQGDFNFKTASEAIQLGTGNWGAIAFAFGLFAAGFTSSITAPLAAAITAQTLGKKAISQDQKLFRITWLIVLSIGGIFSLMDFEPVVIIIIAQAINGLILPFVGISILLVLNDKDIIPGDFQNGMLYNFLMLIVVGVSIFLGSYHVLNVVINALDLEINLLNTIIFSATISGLLIFGLALRIFFKRKEI